MKILIIPFVFLLAACESGDGSVRKKDDSSKNAVENNISITLPCSSCGAEIQPIRRGSTPSVKEGEYAY